MSLGYDQAIVAGDIYFAKVLKESKVFLLNGYGRDRLVVKADSGQFTENDIRLNSKIMAVIDPDSRTKPLTTMEFADLENWCDANLAYSNIIDGATDLKAAINLSRTTPWVKMKALNLLNLDDASKKVGEGDKTDVRIIAAALNAAAGLERLGGVIAADFFIGNTDRFVVSKNAGTWGGETLKTLVNVGNVFIAIDPKQNKGVVKGLDFLDPSGIGRNQATRGLGQRADEWMGAILAKSNAEPRMIFAHDVVDDLNLVLGPRKRKLSILRTKRLDSDAANRLNFGMEDAAQRIRQRIRQYKQSHNGALPPGYEDRLKVMGWTYN